MVDYTDLAFFQAYTRTTFDNTTTPTDTEIQELINMSNAEVEELTGRRWDRVDGYVQKIDSPNELELLKMRPVLNIQSVVDANNNPVDYEIVDRDFIKLSKLVPVTITYDYGYDTPPTAVKMLATLYTLQKVVQGGSAASDNTASITVGPISITSSLGMTSVINLDSDIKKYENRLRRLIV